MNEAPKEYEHFLSYDHLRKAEDALSFVKADFDEFAELYEDFDEFVELYEEDTYTVFFRTDEELSEEEAQELITAVAPKVYDLNNEVDEEHNEVLEGFPAVFFERERDLAIACAEEAEWTIEYIGRLERVAVAAFAYYLKSRIGQNEPALAHALYQELSTVNFMKR